MYATSQETKDANFEFMHYQEDTRAKVEINGRKFIIFNTYVYDGHDSPHIDSPNFKKEDFCQIEIREFKEFRKDWGCGRMNNESEKVWSWYSDKLLKNWHGDREKVFKEEFFSNFKK